MVNPIITVINDFMDIIKETDRDSVKIELSRIVSNLIITQYDTIYKEKEMINYIDKLTKEIKDLETEIKDSYTMIDDTDINTDNIEHKKIKLNNIKNHLNNITYPQSLSNIDNYNNMILLKEDVEAIDMKVVKVMEDIKYIEDKMYSFRDILAEHTDDNRVNIVELRESIKKIEDNINEDIMSSQQYYNLWNNINTSTIYPLNDKKIV